ncbi:hypothetical protein ACHWQZ_G016756 [Mnemiopsis leidyi]
MSKKNIAALILTLYLIPGFSFPANRIDKASISLMKESSNLPPFDKTFADAATPLAKLPQDGPTPRHMRLWLDEDAITYNQLTLPLKDAPIPAGLPNFRRVLSPMADVPIRRPAPVEPPVPDAPISRPISKLNRENFEDNTVKHSFGKMFQDDFVEQPVERMQQDAENVQSQDPASDLPHFPVRFFQSWKQNYHEVPNIGGRTNPENSRKRTFDASADSQSWEEFGEAIAGVLAIALAVALLPFCVWVVKSCSGGSEEDGEDEKCFAKSETEMMGFETMEELPWHRLPESGRLLESGRLQESIRK